MICTASARSHQENALEPGDLSHADYFEAVGRGITAWQEVESQLTGLFSRLLVCAFHGTMMQATFDHHWIAGNILNSITNVNTRLDLVDSTFERLVKDEELRKAWNALRNKIKEKYKRRNALAHGTVWGNENGMSVLGSPMFSIRRQNYKAAEVKDWERSFKALANRIEQFAIAVNRHLVANPLPS